MNQIFHRRSSLGRVFANPQRRSHRARDSFLGGKSEGGFGFLLCERRRISQMGFDRSIRSAADRDVGVFIRDSLMKENFGSKEGV